MIALSDVSRETPIDSLTVFMQQLDNLSSGDASLAFSNVDRNKLRFYPVVDSVEWVARLLEHGVKTVQLRIKQEHAHDLKPQIQQSIQLGRKYDAQVFINDHWQLALEFGAFGVHLGQEDILTADLSTLREHGLCLGISTHSYEELLIAAMLKPSYIALGHIFPTTTKVMPSKPQGLGQLAQYQEAVNYLNRQWRLNIPTVAIGGIDLSNAEPVLECGVDSLAVVRAITQNPNWRDATDRFMHHPHWLKEVACGR